MKKFAIFALSLMLSACWTGPDFYADAPRVQPIPAGKYKVVRVYSNFGAGDTRYNADDSFRQEVGTKLRIAYADNGDAIVTDTQGDGESRDVRLVTLDEAKGLYVAETDPGQGLTSLRKRIYGLVQLVPGGYRLSVPLCDGTRRAKPGSRVIVGGLLDKQRTCSYDDRTTFETAMRKFADDPVSWTEYRWVKG